MYKNIVLTCNANHKTNTMIISENLLEYRFVDNVKFSLDKCLLVEPRDTEISDVRCTFELSFYIMVIGRKDIKSLYNMF
jgi:hypothetical protein